MSDYSDIILSALMDETCFEEAMYDGEAVTLNQPFLLDEEDEKRFGVYAKTKKGDVVYIKFGSDVMKEAECVYNSNTVYDDPATPAFWSVKAYNAVVEKGFADIQFSDRVLFDAVTRTVQTIRDGVQKYLGAEIGLLPVDKEFTVYRSPSTISTVTPELLGLPVIEGHIDPDEQVPDTSIISRILSSTLTEHVRPEHDTTLVVSNKINMSDELACLEHAGVREFSLGYKADIKPHEKYDFEQFDISAKHLALVDKARGGAELTFIDEETGMHKLFTDADGKMNIQRVIEIARALPEALKMIPIDELSKMMPMMEEMMMSAKSAMGVTEEDPSTVEEADGEEVEDKTDGEEMEDEAENDMEDGEMDKEDRFTDAQVQKVIEEKIKFRDEVMSKALPLLGESYVFQGKTTNQIMRDTLALGGSTKFTDSELPIAFKLFSLPEQKSYPDFGKPMTDKLDDVFEKDIS